VEGDFASDMIKMAHACEDCIGSFLCLQQIQVALREMRFAPKVLLPGSEVEEGVNDTLRQNQLLPWQEWTKP
jgi:hypothetical protein